VIYQLLAQGRWVSAGPPASPTTKTGRHAIAEILLTVALKHQKSNQISQYKILISHGAMSLANLSPKVHHLFIIISAKF
jgi:hypothetical protein